MNITLWIVQIVLAVAFGFFGFAKISQPIDTLSAMMPFVTDVPALLVRLIGVAEMAGAFGMILPGITGIQPRSTVAAAMGLALVMILAAAFHVARGEYSNIGLNGILLVLALLVAWGRAVRR
ncbi:MAG: DoxX family protein [Caldilineaceae bacterium]